MQPLFTLMQAAGQQPAGGGWSMIIMMVALFAIVYFFMIRPQNKKQQEVQKFRDNLTVGTDVVTIGGIHGTVKHINAEEKTVVLKVNSSVEIVFELSAINPSAVDAKK